MTLVSLPSPILFPGLLLSPYGVPSLATAVTVDATGEYIAYIFSAREDMTISHVGFMVGAVTNAPTMEVRIESLDATGLPSGTLWNTNTNVTSGTLTAGWTLQALTASASVTKGQMVCIKILWGGVATSTLVVQHLTNCVYTNSNNAPYSVVNTGTPTKTALSALPSLALGSSSTTFYNVPGVMPVTSFAASNFNNTSSAKRGLRFVPNYNCRAVGVRTYKSTGNGDFNILLMNDTGTELSSSSTAVDGDHAVNAVGSSVTYYFDNAVTLTAGTPYRAGIEPTTSTNFTFNTLGLPSVDYYSATPANNSAVATYAALVSGTWTDATTSIPFLDVLIDQVDNGTSTGGVVGVIGG